MWRSAAVVHLIMMTIVLFMYARRDEELGAWIFAQAGLAAIVVGFGVMPLFTKLKGPGSNYKKSSLAISPRK